MIWLLIILQFFKDGLLGGNVEACPKIEMSDVYLRLNKRKGSFLGAPFFCTVCLNQLYYVDVGWWNAGLIVRMWEEAKNVEGRNTS